CARESFDFW
nr:immunoglobulin heavy chain junction region [Mus musculus]